MKNQTTLETNYSSKEKAIEAAKKEADKLTRRGYPTKAIEPIKYSFTAQRKDYYTGKICNIPHNSWKARIEDK